MKQLLMILLLVISLSATAQFGSTYKTTASKQSPKPKVEAFDSALYYYNLAWDNYKLDSMGPARYYWDMASHARGASKYKNASLHRLGLMQQNGEGCDTNLTAALDYYKRAAGMPGKWGDKDAIKAIGGFYENGYGVEQNYAKALEWYKKAKLAGNEYVDDDIKRMQDRLAGK